MLATEKIRIQWLCPECECEEFKVYAENQSDTAITVCCRICDWTSPVAYFNHAKPKAVS